MNLGLLLQYILAVNIKFHITLTSYYLYKNQINFQFKDKMNTSLCSNIQTASYMLVQMKPTQLLQRLFRKYDQNKDGRISKFQFQNILNYLSKLTQAAHPKKADLQDIFCLVDTDGDGVLNQTEYFGLMKAVTTIFQENKLQIKCKVRKN